MGVCKQEIEKAFCVNEILLSALFHKNFLFNGSMVFYANLVKQTCAYEMIEHLQQYSSYVHTN